MDVVVVTGGSKGLGAALCDEYLSRGWRVIEFSRSAPHRYSVQLDLADLGRAAEVFAETFAALASADCREVVAIANAAVLGPVGPTATLHPSEIAAAMDVNVTASIVFASEFTRAFQLERCEKTFVHVSSGAAVHAHAGWSLYSAGKAAIEQFVRVMAAEQAGQPQAIRTFSVNPGVMDTAMQAEVRSADRAGFPEVDRYIRLHEEGLLAQPRGVAAGIAELVASRPSPGETYAVGR